MHSCWQKGHLKVEWVSDYFNAYGLTKPSSFSFDGVAYYVAPSIIVTGNGRTCHDLHLFYIPSLERYVRIFELNCFKPMLDDEVK